jgi:flagellar biogenesis protein FliO
MGSLELAFAVVVTLLAAVCVILALVVVAYWLLVQVHRLRTQLRQPERYWRSRTAVTVPERRP